MNQEMLVEKERLRLFRLLIHGKIKADNEFFVFTTEDGYTFIARGDLIPCRGEILEWQTENWL